MTDQECSIIFESLDTKALNVKEIIQILGRKSCFRTYSKHVIKRFNRYPPKIIRKI